MAAKSVGDCLADMYQFEAAKDKYHLCLAVREKVYGKDHLLVAEASLALGRIYMAQALLSESEAAFGSAQTILLGKQAVLAEMSERLNVAAFHAEIDEEGDDERVNGTEPKVAKI